MFVLYFWLKFSTYRLLAYASPSKFKDAAVEEKQLNGKTIKEV